MGRISCLEMLYEISVLKNSAKFTGKHLCRSLFFNKVSSRRTFVWGFSVLSSWKSFPDNIYLSKVNNRNTRNSQRRRSGIFIVNFEYISHLFLVLLLLNLNK